MSIRTYLSLVLVAFAFVVHGKASAQEKEKVPESAKECLDAYFLNCEALTANACELVSGSNTKTSGKEVYALDFVWFRAQKTETRRKPQSYVDGLSFNRKRGPEKEFWERKLIVGDEGYYGLGPDPPLKPMNLDSRLPEGELEAYLEKQKRLAFSQNGFPEICPAVVLSAINANPEQGTLGKAKALFAKMKLIDEFTKESLLFGTWRLDPKDSPSRACVRITFDKKQGYMPTFVEWRLRDKEAKSDPDDPASFAKVSNQTESKWNQMSKNRWAPVRVVNKSSFQEWIIEATWKLDALKDDYFDAAKINQDREGNSLSKLRRQMQKAKDEADKDKEKKPEEAAKAGKLRNVPGHSQHQSAPATGPFPPHLRGGFCR